MASVKWSNNSVFIPVTVDGTEKLVGLKGSNNIKATISSSLLPYINSNAQLASSSQVTGLNTSLNSKLAKSSNLSDVSNIETSGNNLGFPSGPLSVITGDITLSNPLLYFYQLNLTSNSIISMPSGNNLPATALRRGVPVIFYNLVNGSSGSNIATIKDSSGSNIISIPPGYAASLYLEDNSTSNGSWSYVLYQTVQNPAADVSSSSFSMYDSVPYYSYLSDSASLVTFTLPTTCQVGANINVTGIGSGGWKISQNASQIIRYVGVSTTSGTGGDVSSSNQRASVTLMCTVQNLEFTIVDTTGSIILT